MNALIIIIIFTGLIIFNSMTFPNIKANYDPYFTLVAKTNEGSVRVDVLNLVKQHLARIGIELVIIPVWNFVSEIIAFRDFDLFYMGFTGSNTDPDFTGVYNENGSLNAFGYDTSMDWDDDLNTGLNEWYMKQGTQIIPPNSEERIQHYWNWEQYLMDEICPMLPTFSSRNYIAQWANLKGYNYNGSLLQSFGKMYWEESHVGQESINELIIADAVWSDLNPIFLDDASSSFIAQAIMDPLIYYDDDLSVWPHLAESFTFLNDTHLRINIREGIKWQIDPENNFLNEYLDAEDVYFTLYALKHISNNHHYWDWIEDMKIIDKYTLDIFIDNNNSTEENEPYAPSFTALSTLILPEHYLNQSQLADGVTPNISHPSWETFATNPFGTGLFELSDFIEGKETTLTLNSNCWKLDPVITNDPALEFVRRFGDFSGGLNKLRVKIMPILQEQQYYFESGLIDIVDISSNPEKRTEFQNNQDFLVQNRTYSNFDFLGYNMREARFEVGNRELSTIDPTITKGLCLRKAISYAIDLDEINRVVYGNEKEITYWPIYPTMNIWCNPDIIKYNLDKAKEYFIKTGLETYPTTILHWSDRLFDFLTDYWYIIILTSFFIPLLFFSIKLIIKNNKKGKKLELIKSEANDSLVEK